MINLSFDNFLNGDFLAPLLDGVSAILNQIKRASNPQRVWQEEAKKAYDAQDWNKLWWILKTGASLAPFAGKPVAAFMLDRYLTKGGDINLDYTFAFPGQSNWISQASSTKNEVARLDTIARQRITQEVNKGETVGKLSIRGDVVTDGARDGDLYYALGKFKLVGEYKFSVETNVFNSKRYLKIERVYIFSDVYDWDPKLKGGILPHAYPYALLAQGKAAVFNVEGKFGEREFYIPL